MSEQITVTLQDDALIGLGIPGEHYMTRAAGLPATVKLGRLPPKKGRKAPLVLSNFLSPRAVEYPTATDYTAKAQQSLSRMYLNDQEGDCVIACQLHISGVQTGNDLGTPAVATDAEAHSQYVAICGPGDRGCQITNVLDWQRGKGLLLSGRVHKIDGYAHVDFRSIELVKAAIYLFGGINLGIMLPEEWTRTSIWRPTSSRIVGGHSVALVGYRPDGVLLSSWGRIYLMTWDALASTNWSEECWVIFGPDWYNDDKLAPNGVAVTALASALRAIDKGQLPDVGPEPIPTPTPTPTPEPAAMEKVVLSGSVKTPLGSFPIELTGTSTPVVKAALPETNMWTGPHIERVGIKLEADASQLVDELKKVQAAIANYGWSIPPEIVALARKYGNIVVAIVSKNAFALWLGSKKWKDVLTEILAAIATGKV